MEFELPGPATDQVVENLLGYLNFSSGSTDPQFLQGLNLLYQWLDAVRGLDAERGAANTADAAVAADAPWRRAVQVLLEKLDVLHQTSTTFHDIEQARGVLQFIQHRLVADYLEFHRDLLFHQTEREVFGPFMLGRFLEMALSLIHLSGDAPQWSRQCIAGLNDFIGHRPVAMLESQKIEPRPHEWVRPVPLYIESASVAAGRYGELTQRAIELLSATDADLAQAAFFDFSALNELAFDPRAYDFDHPVNKRPNYHFGEWDPHLIDNQGRYRRFVVREVTLQALLNRVDQPGRLRVPRDELLFEAAAVLAGTILMASGISGSGPDTHDSQTTLMTLIPRIATFRDVFYERLIERLEGTQADRLRNEARQLRQPFGGARQHLNHFLALQRALQLQHARLARVFARMGYLAAAQRKADTIQVAAARMKCRIDCALTAARQAVISHDREAAELQLSSVVDLIHRGIDCGAIADPWNILGFDANFSLFPAIENSVRDHRLDDLIEIMHRIFDLHARLMSDAAAAHDQQIAASIETKFEAIATWWNQFAAHEVSAVDAESPLDEFHAARDVARALREWHLAGATSGDIAFWAPHVESFSSPRAYALVVETLLARGDLVSSMSLLIHWLGQAASVALESSESSFQALAMRWVQATTAATKAATPYAVNPWRLLRKFFDFMEANANEYWSVPVYEPLHGAANLGADAEGEPSGEYPAELEEDAADDDDLFQAAYEDVVYRDSTDDGTDGSVFDTEAPTNTEMEQRSEHVADQLNFLAGLARLWTWSATALGAARAGQDALLLEITERRETLQHWYRHARVLRRDLLQLIASIQAEKIGHPDGGHDSMVEYDRRRLIKESLIEGAIGTCVDVAEAERFLLATLSLETEGEITEDGDSDAIGTDLVDVAQLLAAAMRSDKSAAARSCSDLLRKLPKWQILYVPLAKLGDARQIALARIRQRIIENLVMVLPRLGLLANAMKIVDAARRMERNLPEGRGVVTQFDELFKTGFREMVDSLVRATAPQEANARAAEKDADALLVSYLEKLTEPALESWLLHSRTLRLSVLERVRRPQDWKKLVDFIQDYGADLFTQRFLTLANIRAILHCGSDTWLAELRERGEEQFALIDALDELIPHEEAADKLALILEAIVENFDEYRDYNSTTTQSDRGELLYTMLDFIRLRIEYDRVAWNLKPVVWAHEVLVRRGRNAAAQSWRRMLAERIGEEASRYQRKLTRLQRKYAMKMASVAQRIGERFLLPMSIDRMLALVGPAVERAGSKEASHAFEILEEETDLLLREPALTGADIPTWLEALEEEAERVRHFVSLADSWHGDGVGGDLQIQPVSCSIEELEQQLRLIGGLTKS